METKKIIFIIFNSGAHKKLKTIMKYFNDKVCL